MILVSTICNWIEQDSNISDMFMAARVDMAAAYPDEKAKEQAEKIILDSNATLKKDKLEFVSSNGNIYTYNYKVDDSTAIVSYEVDVEKETYTVVIGQLTKSA